ncbi:zinc finger protein 24-like [Eumetopias jubatus]|uniref:zinc finger protein 24-like n=1 Tax=Eumetopias jubatus TaxID=34886 RepID=UPI00101621BB|nr:zinc finger protein 24-like [Eumetopias jubatus]
MVKVELEEDHPGIRLSAFRRTSPPAWEIFRQQFKHFCYQGSLGPRLALSRLRELCRQWLRPETHSKEQIVELLVLEQFLTLLPEELQARVREQHPESGEQTVTVLEDLEGKRSVPVGRHWSDMVVESLEQSFLSCGTQRTMGKPSIQQGTELLAKPAQ